MVSTALCVGVGSAVGVGVAVTVTVVVAGILGVVVGASPALGLGVALAPLLYVVWANTRFAVGRELRDRTSPTHGGWVASAAG